MILVLGECGTALSGDESLEGSPPRERLLFDSPPAAARTAGRSKAQRSGSKLLMPQRRRPSGDIFNVGGGVCKGL